MCHNIFITQIKRSKKIILYLGLLVLVSSFFVTSVNLYYNSIHNLQVAKNTFSTLVVTELYGEVDKFGKLVKRNSEEHIGYKAVGVKGYDFREWLKSDAVESYDLRSQYGAYIEGHPAVVYAPLWDSFGEKTEQWYMRSQNVICFKINASEPIVLDYHTPDLYRTETWTFPLKVLKNAAGFAEYPQRMAYDDFGFDQEEWTDFEEEIKKLNQTNDTDKIILYPDEEYVAVLRAQGSWQWRENKEGMEHRKDLWYDEEFNLFTPVQDYEKARLTYDGSSEHLEYEKKAVPFPIQRLEDVRKDPELQAYFKKAWKDTSVQQYTHNVTATNDVTSVPAFHIGNASLKEGRLITQEEYEKGSKVCIISEEMAENQRWKIGDKLHMKLFESDYIPAYDPLVDAQPVYDIEKTPFIQEAKYEIIGIYEIHPDVAHTEHAPDTLALLPYQIYLPTNSIAKQRDFADTFVHGSTLSIKLKNGLTEKFQADVDQMMNVGKENYYEPNFTFYDQGYSVVESGLSSMNSMAKFLLLLSSILLFFICFFAAYFFWQSQRQTVGIFRLLGGTKKQVLAAVLGCTIVLTIWGTVIGGIAGSGISYIVGNEMMRENSEEMHSDFSQEHGVSAMTEQEKNLKMQINPLVMTGACSAILIYPVLLLGFAVRDLDKEPRELLPKGKG